MLDGANRRLLGFVAVFAVAVVWLMWALHRPPRPVPDVTLRAGGATSIYPMMASWASEYNKATGIQVAYASTGSGAGIVQMIGKATDFGCSDAPLNAEQLRKAKDTHGDVVHIPLAFGAVVPVYNLPEINKPVRFTGPVLADIYLGKINNWDDSRLQELQEEDVLLPNKPMRRFHRSDVSSTTALFSEFLAGTSPAWISEVGAGAVVRGPANSTGGKG